MPTEAGTEADGAPGSPGPTAAEALELGWQRAERLALGFAAPGPAEPAAGVAQPGSTNRSLADAKVRRMP